MNERDAVLRIIETIDERDSLRLSVSILRNRHKRAMEILRDDPDAANAATEAWDILNGGACETGAAAFILKEGVMELIDVVRRLVGPIDPVGDQGIDNKRFENLKVMTKLVDILVGDLDCVAENKLRNEFSMKRAGEFADKFLDDLGIED